MNKELHHEVDRLVCDGKSIDDKMLLIGEVIRNVEPILHSYINVRPSKEVPYWIVEFNIPECVGICTFLYVKNDDGKWKQHYYQPDRHHWGNYLITPLKDKYGNWEWGENKSFYVGDRWGHYWQYANNAEKAIYRSRKIWEEIHIHKHNAQVAILNTRDIDVGNWVEMGKTI